MNTSELKAKATEACNCWWAAGKPKWSETGSLELREAESAIDAWTIKNLDCASEVAEYILENSNELYQYVADGQLHPDRISCIAMNIESQFKHFQSYSPDFQEKVLRMYK